MAPLRELCQGALSMALELVAPSRCAACGQQSLSTFCEACGTPEGTSPEELGGVPLLTAGRYASPLKEAIARFKYGGHPELGRALARTLTEKVSTLAIRRDDAFVPVPLHASRLADRGYNQSALLAQALAGAHGARFIPRLLERVRQTAQQAALDQAGRADNMAGAFRVRQALRSGRVILVDDVVTTGATLLACLSALATERVSVLAVVALGRAKQPEKARSIDSMESISSKQAPYRGRSLESEASPGPSPS